MGTVRLFTASVAALLIAGGTVAAGAPAASAASAGTTLSPGQSVSTSDGRYRLVMQGDGNLVQYRSDGRVVWHSGTAGNPGGRLVVQGDGNVVLYAPSGRALWHTATNDGRANRLELRDDGRLHVLSPEGWVRWSRASLDLRRGEAWAARDLSHRLVLQGDGNLVVYTSAGRAAWHASTHGTAASRVVHQADGNLVAYDGHGTPVWHSATSGHRGGRLVLQSDGNLVVYTSAGRAVWASSWSRGVAYHPRYVSAAFGVTEEQLGASWRAGCPVGPASLRRLQVRYVGFDARWRTGELVVHADAVGAVSRAFGRMYDARFPLASVRPVSVYGGSDDASMDANNTSAFNCRTVSGTSSWSQHAYGRAVDVNPVQNPYVSGAAVFPEAGRAYVDRRHVRPGMAVPGSAAVSAFSAEGWGWGGAWSSVKDYQHFSANGR